MMRYAAGLAAVILSSIAVSSAQADRGAFHGRSHERFESPRQEAFEHRRPFLRHRHVFFRPFIFFGAPVFGPVPVALYPAQPYPAYFMAPIDGWPNYYEYQTTVVMGGLAHPAFGTACLGPDGLWHIY
jgi:hypothetical protein